MKIEYFKGRTPPLLEVRNLTREFRTGLYFGTSFKAVDDVNFILGQEKPKILSIAGESGCGETTLAKMILGIQKPTRGMILYKGEKVSKLRGKEKKGLDASFSQYSKTLWKRLIHSIGLIII